MDAGTLTWLALGTAYAIGRIHENRRTSAVSQRRTEQELRHCVERYGGSPARVTGGRPALDTPTSCRGRSPGDALASSAKGGVLTG